MAKRKQKISKVITLSGEHHEKLVKHCMDRMEISKKMRDSQADKFEKIDKQVYGYQVLTEDDQKRQLDNEKGYGIKPVDNVLPLTLTSLDEAVTFLIEVIKNDTKLYAAIAPKDKQVIANAFTAVMNENATKFKHLSTLNRFLFDALKYNFSAVIPSWHVVHGNKIKNNTSQTGPEIESGIVYEGNKLGMVNPYNFFYDLSVNPILLANEGEYFATVDVLNNFKVKKLEAEEKLTGVKRFINQTNNVSYYKERPVIRAQDSVSGDSDFISLLSQGSTQESISGQEIITMYIWLVPKEFGLSQSKDFEIWRFKIANGKYVADAERMNNAHGMLPVGISMPWEDGFQQDTKSYAELLEPFNTFASFQMNVNTKSHRKALYGLTFYNKNVVDLDDNYDPVAGKIPVNAPPDADLNKALKFFNDTPDSNETMKNIEAMADLMQKILPTDILRQVAGLERATQYQSAATVQGANRRNLKIARMIHEQALSTTNMMQMYNILQYQKLVEVLTPEGEFVQADPAKFRDAKLEFEMSDGLQGLDKLSMIMHIKEVLNTIVQSQQANDQMDVTAIINYWTSMLGDNTDFSQFKFQSEIDKLPPQQRDLAFQLLQQFMEQQENAETPAAGAGGAAPTA